MGLPLLLLQPISLCMIQKVPPMQLMIVLIVAYRLLVARMHLLPINSLLQSVRDKHLKKMIDDHEILATFENFANIIDNLNNEQENTDYQQNLYCNSYGGQSMVNNPDAMTCSPLGWFKFFTNNFLMSPFFLACPGMLYYLCNNLGDDCYSTTKYSVNGQSLYDFIQSTFSGINNTLTEPATAFYYQTFAQQYPEDFFKYVMLPFILVAQNGPNIFDNPNIFWAAFAGGAATFDITKPWYSSLFSTINQHSGFLWNNLNPTLQQQLSNGFSLCQDYDATITWNGTNNNANSPAYPTNYAQLPNIAGTAVNNFPTSALLNSIVLGQNMALSIAGGSSIWTPSNGISIYEQLLKCCACQPAPTTTPPPNSPSFPQCNNGSNPPLPFSPESSAFMCDMLTAQANILTALKDNQEAQFSLAEMGGLQAAINKAVQENCSGPEQTTINDCMKTSFPQAVQTCISNGTCVNENDTSANCIACVSAQVKQTCASPENLKNIQSCTQKAIADSELIPQLKAIAATLTNISKARLHLATLVKKYSLNASTLPTFTESHLVQKCYAFCNTPNQINYTDLEGWNEASTAYNNAFSFLSQMTSTIYKTCPAQQTGMDIFMNIVGVIGPIIGVVMSIADPVMLVMWAATEGISISQQVTQAMQTTISSQINLQSTENQLANKE